MQYEDPILKVDVTGSKVVLCGEVDMSTADLMEQALLECVREGWQNPVVDLSAVTYFDSSGIQALLRAREALSGEQGNLRIVGANPHAVRVFRLVGLDDLLIFDKPSV